MALLLDDLLDIARITEGKLQLRKETLSLVSDASMPPSRPRGPSSMAKNQHLQIRLPAEPIWLRSRSCAPVADPVQPADERSQVQRRADSHIELTATAADGMLTLSVKDDGIGIAPQSIASVFDMFSQVDGMEGRSEGGLGIGLALVKGLAELHGGTVEARSAGLGRGSEFIVRLAGHAATPSAASSRRGLARTRRLPCRRRILIADDNQDAAESLAMLLELGGHAVRTAHLRPRGAVPRASRSGPTPGPARHRHARLERPTRSPQRLRREPWAPRRPPRSP